MQFLTYILSPITHLYYLITFCIFHLIQIFTLKVFGEKYRLKSIVVLNFFLTRALYILGSKIIIKGKENLPDNSRPVIIVSNHQSLYDIPIIGHLFRGNTVKFVAKKSLGKGIPCVSYNLRNGGSALIDRNNGGQAIRELFKLGKHIQENKYAACIYPEGTRSKTGKVQEFQSAGVATILRSAPDAIIVPFAIKGHSSLIAKSNIWMKVGQRISYTIFPAIDPKGKNIDDVINDIYLQIKQTVEN